MVLAWTLWGMGAKYKSGSKRFSNYPRLNPLGIGRDISAADLIDKTFMAYNGGRLREAAQLVSKKMLPRNSMVKFLGMSSLSILTELQEAKNLSV